MWVSFGEAEKPLNCPDARRAHLQNFDKNKKLKLLDGITTFVSRTC